LKPLLPFAATPITPGTSTGITTHAFVISRVTGVVSSGLVTSWVGCARSSDSFPSAATTTVPRDCANRIARCSASQIARCSGSFLQLKSHGSAK
jgi:hypothetical protein